MQKREAAAEKKSLREQGPQRRPEEAKDTFRGPMDGLLAQMGSPAAGAGARPESHAAVLQRTAALCSGGAVSALLRLQRAYGNRHVQRVVALARQAAGNGEGALDPEIESSIQRARGGGRTLDGATRAHMESAFGVDFGGVRIHTGAEADRLNRAVSARAFTTGSDVFFRQGEYSPGSSSGRELLAHELTHVLQQSGVVQQSGAPVQAKLTLGAVDTEEEREADQVAREVVRRAEAPAPAAFQRSPAERLQRQPATAGAQQEKWEKFPIKIPAGVDTTLQLLRYVEVQIFGRVVNLSWDTSKEPDTHEPAKHVGKSIVFKLKPSLLAAHGVSRPGPAAKAEADQEYKELGPADKEAVIAEIDKRYYETTQEAPGTRIKPGEKGKAVIWNSLRDEVLADRKRLELLPDTIREMIGESNLGPEHSRILAQVADALSQLSDSEVEAFFVLGPNGAVITPDDYPRLLSIAQKLAALSPAARKDYLGRVSASTTSLAGLEGAIDRYVEFRAEREKQFQEHEAAAGPLLGAEDVYTAYRSYKEWEKNVGIARALKSSAREGAESYEYLQDKLRESEAALLAALKHKGFDSIPAFEAALESYRVAFRTQAVNLALDVLDRYDHMLYEESRKLQEGAAASIAQGIAAGQAPAQYKEYHEQKKTALLISMGSDPEGFDTSWVEPYMEAERAAETAKKTAESEVLRGAGDHPLIAERNIDLEELAGLDAAGVHSYLTEQIAERSAKVREARQELKDHPDRIFKKDDLVAATQTLLGIDPTTIYGRRINDYIANELPTDWVLVGTGILAVALAFLVPGGGWLAAAALVAQAGISTYQVYSAYQEYQEQQRDYELGFLSQEPSLFWVGVAAAAAALDIGVATSLLLKRSAPALKALKEPLLEGSKDTSKLPELLEKIRTAKGLDARFKAALEREAKALPTLKEAWEPFRQKVRDIGSRLNDISSLLDPAIARELFRALYYSIRRGVNTITMLSAEARFLEIAGDITQMSGARREEIEIAFKEVQEIVEAGRAKGVAEGALEDFVERLAINRGKPGFKTKLLEEVQRWKPMTEEQRRALSALEAQKRHVADLYEKKTAALEELDELRAEVRARRGRGRPGKEAKEIRKLEKEIELYDPEELTGKERFIDPRRPPVKKEGKIAEAEKKLAELEAEAARAQLSLYDRLRAAVPTDRAKEQALRGVTADQVGPLKTRPGNLQVDHVVSVREIADMDGFADLPWKHQKEIVDLKPNLVAMDASANASKGDRTWRSWGGAKRFYEQSTIDAMVKHEADVRALIEKEIRDRLAKLAAGTL